MCWLGLGWGVVWGWGGGLLRKGGEMEGWLWSCRHTTDGQQQLSRRQKSFYLPPALQPDVVEVVFWVQCQKASWTDMQHGKVTMAYFIKALAGCYLNSYGVIGLSRLWSVIFSIISVWYNYRIFHNCQMPYILPLSSPFVLWWKKEQPAVYTGSSSRQCTADS